MSLTRAWGPQHPTMSVTEREFIGKINSAKQSAFSPRSIQKLINQKKSRSILDIECACLLRDYYDRPRDARPIIPYLMWLETGKHRAPEYDRPDPEFSSSVWRNVKFAHALGDDPHLMSFDDRRMEATAAIFPLKIPGPSQMGDYTYGRYLRYNKNVIKDPVLREEMIKDTELDLKEFRKRRLYSESRNPPIDEYGFIQPPLNYKHFEKRQFPPIITEVDTKESGSLQNEPTYVDSIGQRIPKSKHKPHIIPNRLRYNRNNPNYPNVIAELQKRLDEKRLKMKFKKSSTPKVILPPPSRMTNTSAK